jgi:hypothetical protein
MALDSSDKSERIFLKDGDVRVTSTRLIFDGKTYALRNISSVSLTEIAADTSSANQMIIWGIILSLCTCGLTLIRTVIGFIQLSNALPTFAVCLQSNAGEVHALISADREYIESVVRAVEKAIVAYG